MTNDPFEFGSDAILGEKTDETRAEPARSKERVRSEKRDAPSKAYTRLNDRLSYFVIASAILAAVPIGLNRPTHWLIWGALCALVTVSYVLLGARIAPSRPLLSERQPLIFGLALIVPGWALLQAVPIPAVLGQALGWPIDMPAPTAKAISILPGATIMAALRYTFYIMFAVLCIEVSSRTDRATRVGWMIFWGVVLHAVWALLALRALGDIHFWGPKTAYLGSATGTFINRNSFATFLAMGGTLGLALVLDRANAPRRRHSSKPGPLSPESMEQMVVWLGLVTIYVTLLATQSRMGFASGAVGAGICFVLMRLKSGATLLRTMLLTLGLGSVAALAGLALFGDAMIGRAVFLENSLEGRAAGYKLVKDLIAARPLTGFGMDTFRPAFEWVHAPPLASHAVWDRAHSTYLTHWSELGLIVGTVPVIIGLLALYRLVDVIRRRRLGFALPIAALSAIVVGGMHSLVDFSLEMPANVILLIAISGLGLAHRVDKRGTSEE